MSRIRATAAATALGAFLLVGVGATTAHADNGAGANDHSNSSVVGNAGSGDAIGTVTGNVANTRQTATGSGASNQNNGRAVTGNGGSIGALQGNGHVDARVSDPHVLHQTALPPPGPGVRLPRRAGRASGPRATPTPPAPPGPVDAGSRRGPAWRCADGSAPRR
ncbi:hypothetical protein [Kitasatospora aureofaciens]|uniref:hypothetical protein n=1 Tax=Kitasatospora aureofaciens TaxID=1894 RepID=UPI00190037FA|nr:hypothetical protein [Kitasatospora aureofaciens]